MIPIAARGVSPRPGFAKVGSITRRGMSAIGTKRTNSVAAETSASDPKRTSGNSSQAEPHACKRRIDGSARLLEFETGESAMLEQDRYCRPQARGQAGLVLQFPFRCTLAFHNLILPRCAVLPRPVQGRSRGDPISHMARAGSVRSPWGCLHQLPTFDQRPVPGAL